MYYLTVVSEQYSSVVLHFYDPQFSHRLLWQLLSFTLVYHDKQVVMVIIVNIIQETYTVLYRTCVGALVTSRICRAY